MQCELRHNPRKNGFNEIFRMKIVSIHQPHYHPWLGLLHKIACSDLHIVLDDVQFRRRNFHNRALYTSHNSSQYLSLPVLNKGLQSHSLKINEIQIASEKDLQKQFLTLMHCYSKTAGWPLIESELEEIYSTHSSSLFELNFKLLKLLTKHYKISTPIKLASSFNIQSTRNQRLIDLCIKNNATTYLSGNGARKYMDDDLFEKHQIKVEYQAFEHPTYQQIKCDSFTPGSLALEWLCLDPEQAQSWLKGQYKKSGQENRETCFV